MILDEAIDMIRSAAQRQAVPRGKSRKRNLWDTVIAQIAERDSFDGECFDTFVDLIRDLCPHLAEARPAQLKLWQSPMQELDTLRSGRRISWATDDATHMVVQSSCRHYPCQ